jgi:hypothetical protein
MAVQNALQYAHEAAVFAHRAIDDALRTALKQALEAGKFRCAECGRAFKTPSEFRYNAKHKPACRTRCKEAK